MEINFDSPDNFIFSQDEENVQVAKERMTLNSELLHRCLRRPAEPLAWSEFVRRFTPIIRASIEKSLQLLETEGEKRNHEEAIVEAVIEMVYVKLTANRCQALQYFAAARINSLKPYLMLISINAVREYLCTTRVTH